MYSFEPGFAEEDHIWKADERETLEHRMQRGTAVLETIFEENHDTCGAHILALFMVLTALYSDISITAHGGIINGILLAVGRSSAYSLPTGGNDIF